MKINLIDEKGSALVYVLILTVVLTILGVSLLNVSLSETRFAVHNKNKIQAEYIARVGVDTGVHAFIDDPFITTITTPKIFPTADFGNGSFVVKISKNLDSQILVESTATVGNANITESRVLTKSTYDSIFQGIRQTGKDPLELGALPISYDVGETVLIEGNVSNLGDITLEATDAIDPNIIKKINDNPIAPFVVPTIDASYTTTGTLLGDQDLVGNYKINGSLIKGNNDNITFNTGSGEQIIIVDSISFKGSQGEVRIEGGGYVSMYVLDDSTIQTPISVNVTNPELLFIYLADGKSLELTANATLNAYIYAPKATVEINSSQTTLYGAIVGNIINRGNTNGALGNFYFKALPDNTANTSIEQYVKSVYYK